MYIAVAFIIKSAFYLHSVLIGFVLFLKQAAKVSLDRINWWVLITETACCEMRYKLYLCLHACVQFRYRAAVCTRIYFGNTDIPTREMVIFTFTPCIFILSKVLFTNECTSDCLKNNTKIYIKIAPTCFGACTPSSGSSLSVLAKVTLC